MVLEFEPIKWIHDIIKAWVHHAIKRYEETHQFWLTNAERKLLGWIISDTFDVNWYQIRQCWQALVSVLVAKPTSNGQDGQAFIYLDYTSV